MLIFGDLPRDLRRAKSLLSRAAGLGHQRAGKLLENLERGCIVEPESEEPEGYAGTNPL